MAEGWLEALDRLNMGQLRYFACLAVERDPELARQLESLAREAQKKRDGQDMLDRARADESDLQEAKAWETELEKRIRGVNQKTRQALGSFCGELSDWAEEITNQLAAQKRWKQAGRFSMWYAHQAERLAENPWVMGLSLDADVWEDWDEWNESFGLNAHDLQIDGISLWLKTVHDSLETDGLEIFRDFLYHSPLDDSFANNVSTDVHFSDWLEDLFRREEQRISQEEPDTQRGKNALEYLRGTLAQKEEMIARGIEEMNMDGTELLVQEWDDEDEDEDDDLAIDWDDVDWDDYDDWENEEPLSHPDEEDEAAGEADAALEEAAAQEATAAPETAAAQAEAEDEEPGAEADTWIQALDAVLEKNGRDANADLIGIAEDMDHLIAERTGAFLQENLPQKAHAFCRTAYAWMVGQADKLEPQSIGLPSAPYLVQAVMDSCCRAWAAIVPAAPANERGKMLQELRDISWPWTHDPLAVLMQEFREIELGDAEAEPKSAASDDAPEDTSAPEDATEVEAQAAEQKPGDAPDLADSLPEDDFALPEMSLEEDEDTWEQLFETVQEGLDLEEPQDMQICCRRLIRLTESRIQGFLEAGLRLKAHWFAVVMYQEGEDLQDLAETLDDDFDDDLEDNPAIITPEDILKACAAGWKQILAAAQEDEKPEIFEDLLDLSHGEWGSYAEEVLLQTSWGQEEQVELLDYLGDAIEEADYEERRAQLLQKLTDAEATVARYSGPVSGNGASEAIQTWRKQLTDEVAARNLSRPGTLSRLISDLENMLLHKVREMAKIQDFLGAYQHTMETYLQITRLQEQLQSGALVSYDWEHSDVSKASLSIALVNCGEMIGAIASLAAVEIRRGMFRDLFTIARQHTYGLTSPLIEGPWAREELEEVLQYLERRRTYEPSADLEDEIETLQNRLFNPHAPDRDWDAEIILEADDEDWDDGADWDEDDDTEDDDEDDEDQPASPAGKASGVGKGPSDATSYDYLFWDAHLEDLWARRIQTEVEYADFDDPDCLEEFCGSLEKLLERQVQELKRKGCWRGAFCSCVRLYQEANKLQDDLEDGTLSPFAADYLDQNDDAAVPMDVAEECARTAGRLLKEAPAASLERILKEVPEMAKALQEDFRKVLREAPWTAEQKQTLLTALGEQPKEMPTSKKAEAVPKAGGKSVAQKVEADQKDSGKPAAQTGKKKAASKQSIEEAAARKRLADYRRSGLTQQYWEELRKLVLESPWATLEDVRTLKSMSPVRKWQGILEELKSSPAWKDRQEELQEFLGK